MTTGKEPSRTPKNRIGHAGKNRTGCYYETEIIETCKVIKDENYKGEEARRIG
jgi:hypothetical protein